MAGFVSHPPQSPQTGFGNARYLHDIPESSEELDFELQPTGRVESQESGIDVVELIASLEDSELDYSDLSSQFPKPGGPLYDVLQDFQLPSSDELFPDDTLPDLAVPERENAPTDISPHTSVFPLPENPNYDSQLDFSFALPNDPINAAALLDFRFRHSDDSSFYTSQATESGHYHYPVQEVDHDSVLDQQVDQNPAEFKNGDPDLEPEFGQSQRWSQAEQQDEHHIPNQGPILQHGNQDQSQEAAQHGDAEGASPQSQDEDSQESMYSQSVACRLSRNISETSETICASPQSLQPPDQKMYQDFDWSVGTFYRGSIQPTCKSIFASHDRRLAETNHAHRKVFSEDIAGSRQTWLVIPDAPQFVCEVTNWRDSRETLCSFYQEYFDDEYSRDNVAIITPMSLDAVVKATAISEASCENASPDDTTDDTDCKRPITMISIYPVADEIIARPADIDTVVSNLDVPTITLDGLTTSNAPTDKTDDFVIIDEPGVLLHGTDASDDLAIVVPNIATTIKELAKFIHDAAIIEDLDEDFIEIEALNAITSPDSTHIATTTEDTPITITNNAIAPLPQVPDESNAIITPEFIVVPQVTFVETEIDDEDIDRSSPPSPALTGLAPASPIPASPPLPPSAMLPIYYSPPAPPPLPPSPPPPPASPPPPSPPRLVPPTRAPPLPPALPAPPVLAAPSPQPSPFPSFDALDTRDLSETPPTPPSSFQARPVDRGFTAWLQVLGASLLFLNAWGLVSAFGTFQTYYHVILLAGTSNASIVSIGSLAGFLLCATPLAWNIIFGGEGVRLPMRLLLLIGSMLTVLGLFLTSLCTTLWQFLLTQAVCCGLGSGCLFLVAASILPSYFVRRRALALGLAASGSGVGGIVYPLVFRSLLPRFGFAWSVRAVAMVALVTLVIPCIILRQRPSPDTQPHPQSDDDEETPSPPRRSLHITCTALLKDRAYLAFNTATFFSFAGAYIPFFFIEQHAARHGMPLSGSMLLFLHIGSIPGTLLPALLANRREDRQNFLHPVYLFSGLSGSAALLAFLWAGIPARATALLAVWCVLFGFCMGACAGLQGAVLTSLTPIEASSSSESEAQRDEQQEGPMRDGEMQMSSASALDVRSSGNFFAGALGLLVGGPVAGLMVGRAWIYAQVFCGVMLAFATIAALATLTLLAPGTLKRRSRRGRSPTVVADERKGSSSTTSSAADWPRRESKKDGVVVGVVDVTTGDESRPRRRSTSGGQDGNAVDDNDNDEGRVRDGERQKKSEKEER